MTNFPSLRGAKATKQSSFSREHLDCFAAFAMTNAIQHYWVA
jgi:hypothetical protein